MPGAQTRLTVRPRWWAAIVVLVLALALAGALAARYSWRRGGRHVPLAKPAEPLLIGSAVQVAPRIYSLGALSPSAAYVIETSAGLILVDSGLDPTAGLLKSQMESLGLDWKRLRAILLTHVHGDHSGGAGSLRASTGATVYAGAGDVDVLKAGTPREAFFSTFYMPSHHPQPTTVDVALTGGEAITVGDTQVQALATPGHTPGSMCYLLERDGLRVFFSGDVIMMLRGDDQPRTELDKPLGTYSAYLAPRYRGNAQAYLATLNRLRTLRAPDLLLPGHPRADVRPENPHLAPKQWDALLDRGIHDMETLLDRYQTDGADFLDGVPKELLPDLYYLGDFHGRAVYGFFAASRLFLVDAPGGPGLVNFVDSSLHQLGRKWTSSTATVVLLTAQGSEETAGLRELFDKCPTQVVAAYESIEWLKQSYPQVALFLAAEDLSTQGWFPVRLVSLGGRGKAPVGYMLNWAGKNVLFSGRIPVKIDHDESERLTQDLVRSREDLRDYFACLTRLNGMKIDVWLPATPTCGQNANLYDGDWRRVIEDNLKVVKFAITITSGK
jgi:glyoxylase-like metal-dependent hydrolase (beta-lactamase superfamily II)